METELIVKDGRIEARYKRNELDSPITAIAFGVIMGKWTVATSMCLPSNIEEAKTAKECFDLAFDALDKIEI
jgi:hypothetical protein